MKPSHTGDTRAGLLYGLGAYGFWGLIPLYFRQLTHVPAPELLAQRVLWSMVLMALLTTALRRWADVRRCLRVPSIRRTLLLTTTLIAVNWFVYIHGVVTQRVTETSLGYFIAPLASAGLGVVVLRERLRGLQVISLALAAVGVAVLTGATGEFPWIALTLATSFSLYGLFRKTVAADSLTGLTVETVLLVPVALGYIVWREANGIATFGHLDRETDLWMVAGGAITVGPLYCFGRAARGLRLTTLGLLQYISPTVQLALAVAVLHEPFDTDRLAGFALIWAALLAYTFDAIWTAHRRRADERVAVPIPD